MNLPPVIEGNGQTILGPKPQFFLHSLSSAAVSWEKRHREGPFGWVLQMEVRAIRATVNAQKFSLITHHLHTFHCN